MKRWLTTPRTERQWRIARAVGAIWFPLLFVLDILDRDWWFAGIAAALGTGFVALATAGARDARTLERLRRGGDLR